jgi:hypothetical protein
VYSTFISLLNIHFSEALLVIIYQGDQQSKESFAFGSLPSHQVNVTFEYADNGCNGCLNSSLKDVNYHDFLVKSLPLNICRLI